MNDSSIPFDDTTQDQDSLKWDKIEGLQNYLAKMLRQHDGGKQIETDNVWSQVASMISDRAPETEQSGPPDIASGDIDYDAQVAKRRETVGTGIAGLNNMLSGGLESQRLLALLGGPGGGKTSLANQIAVHAADSGRPVLYVTSEDIPFNLLAKTLARQGKIDFSAVLKGYEDKKELISQALASYRNSPAATRLRYLDATVGTSLSIIQACAAAHFEAFKYGGNGILVIDYLQRLARSLSAYRDGKQDIRLAVTGIAEELRKIATELDCCVIALASQNRNSGYSADRNALATGKESGDIEYTADVVMAIGADERDDRLPTTDWLDPKILRIDKNRQGVTGEILLDWYGSRQQFTEAPKDEDVSKGKKGGRK